MQYLGDGLLVYFGYPLAHEDDAQRAVRAGLGMVEAMGTLNTRLAQRPASTWPSDRHSYGLGRRGGDRRGRPPRAVSPGGDAQYRRLQSLAAPDAVVISAATARLVEGYFVCQALNAQALKVSPCLPDLAGAAGERGADPA